MSGQGRNVKPFYVRILKKIRYFLFSKKNRELLIFLFFLFISASFWFMQTLNDTYDYEFAVSFRIKNVPDKMVITSEIPSTVRFTVRDKGTVLLNYMFGQSFYPIVLDWNDYYNNATGNRIEIPQADLLKSIKGQLITSTKIVAIKSEAIDVVYTKGEAKKIPVRLQARIITAKQFYISQILIKPDSVLVYAPKKLLDSLKVAYTVDLQLHAVSDTTKEKIPLRAVHGAKFVPEVVAVQLNTDIYMEKSLEIPITGVRFPDNKALKTFPSKITVTFQTGLLESRNITSNDFKVVTDYDELMKKGRVVLHILSAPRGIKNVRISQQNIDYLIESK